MKIRPVEAEFHAGGGVERHDKMSLFAILQTHLKSVINGTEVPSLL
jgi:hypothetical protein